MIGDRVEARVSVNRRDEQTGDAVLARSWSELFALMRTIDIPEDFMVDRPMNASRGERDTPIE
jgi:antitoxin VapB